MQAKITYTVYNLKKLYMNTKLSYFFCAPDFASQYKNQDKYRRKHIITESNIKYLQDMIEDATKKTRQRAY